jgi:hypothetical protein
MRAKITGTYSTLPYGAVGEVIEVRNHPIGPSDYFVHLPDGSGAWVSGYHLNILPGPPPTHDPAALEEWLRT